MKRRFVWRGWSILGFMNTYLGWKYNILLVISIEIKTNKVFKAFVIDANEFDRTGVINAEAY